MARYFPAGIGSNSTLGSTWPALKPCRSAILLVSWVGMGWVGDAGFGWVAHDAADDGIPGQRNLRREAVAVLCHARRPSDGTEHTFAAAGTKGRRDGPLAAEAGVFG